MTNAARNLLVANLLSALACSGPALGQDGALRLPEPVRVAERPTSVYIARTWTADDGLPVNSVNEIEQTADGYLWLATFGGLARFDGIAFHNFNSADRPGFGDNRVLSLHEDREGTLWVGTEHSGIFALRDGSISVPAWSDELPALDVHGIFESRDGALWLRTSGGTLRVDPGGDATVLRARSRRAPLQVAILDTVDGPKLLGTYAGGVRGYKGPELRTASLGVGDDVEAHAIAADAGGRLWLATENHGLLRLHDGRFEPVPSLQPASRFAARTLLSDPSGAIWLGTAEGSLLRLDGTRLGQPVIEAALAHRAVRSLHRDREGNLWVGTDGDGLIRLTRRSVTAHVPAQGPQFSLMPIVGDGAGGLWAGATCGGLLHFEDGVFELYGRTESFPAHCILSLHRDADGTLWIGKLVGGVLRLRDGRLTALSAAQGLDGEQARAILRDPFGALWVGTETAVNRLGADGKFTPHRLPEPATLVHSLAARRTGGLWVGTRNGLYRFADGEFIRVWPDAGAPSAPVRDVLEDPDGTLWLATYGSGLVRLHDGRVTLFTRSNGLFDVSLSRLLDDGRGRLWLSSNRGVFHVSRRELDAVAAGDAAGVTSVWFDRRDGMASSEANGGGQPAGWRAPDGRLWFPTIDGLVEFDPTVERNPNPPRVSIRRVIADHRALGIDGPLELPPGTRTLEIRYVGLSYRAPEKVRYQYQLEGYDEDWVDARNRRAVYYTSLPSGSYRFRVRARNEDGVWSDGEAALDIRQRPRFYQTPWFLVLAAGLLVVAALAGYRLRLRHLMRRTARLEAAVEARTNEVVSQRDRIAEENARVEKSREDLLTVLNQTGVGVCVVDGEDRVQLLNVTAERVLRRTHAEAVGRPWQTILALSPDDRARVERTLTQPAEQRIRLPIRLDTIDHHRYWIELDARDDPRDPAQRIFYLHDVTELYDLQGLIDGRAQFQGMVGDTTVMRIVYRQIRDVAMVDSTVILEGETGTGKELVARAIHDLSERRGRPYLAVNCAGLTESLLNSQLFGHRRGAFTGAVGDQIGLFEAAGGGTLLLDEIGDIPLSVQASLLRVLQEGEITRVGESRPRRIDVRIVAATHRDLAGEVAAGRFRQDLYFRLKVARIRIPPLRERRDDIPVLVAWFLAQARATGHTGVYEVSREAMNLLLTHRWPGNVRELRSVVESAAFATQGPMMEVTDLPEEFVDESRPDALASAAEGGGLDARESRHVRRALELTHGNRAAAARLLGVSRTTLYRRLREFGLDR